MSKKQSYSDAFAELQQIVADIIAHVRTAALGISLVSQEDRIRNAILMLKEKKLKFGN